MNNQYAKSALSIAKAVQEEAILPHPPEAGGMPNTDQVIPFSVVRNTRGYIEKVTNQVNGCYEKGWYDACAVMIRRLVETLIIEAFENNNIDQKIKDGNGNFLSLRDLMNKTLAESSWNLGRNTKRALPKIKSIGDKSAHSRRFNAHYGDIRRITPGLREAVQELIYIAGLK